MKRMTPLSVMAVTLLMSAALFVEGAKEKADAGGGQAGGGKVAEEGKAPLAEAHDLMQKARERISEIEDYTAKFHKREYVNGKFLPEEVIRMKVRRDPRRLYMRWVGKVNKGQEVIWGKGWNDGKLKAHRGGWFSFITVNLDPEGAKAMKKNRHSIAEAGFEHTINLIARDLERARSHPEHVRRIEDLGTKEIYGQEARGFDARLDREKHSLFYSYRARVWIHRELKLPVRIQIWDREDGKIRLVEDYGYEEIKTDVGLKDEDFDPDNPDYDF
jgi:hypothetical protein